MLRIIGSTHDFEGVQAQSRRTEMPHWPPAALAQRSAIERSRPYEENRLPKYPGVFLAGRNA
jgi:hypothetical protein